MDQTTTILSISTLIIIPLCLCYRHWHAQKDREKNIEKNMVTVAVFDKPILAEPFLALP